MIPLRGTASGTPLDAYNTAIRRGARRGDFLSLYLKALYDDAATLGINADVLVAQWDLETGAGTSARWINEGNPAGIGITDGKTDAGHRFNADEAARVHVTHMACYLGITPHPSWIAADFRWQAALDAGFFGSVTTTADLGKGKWATDPDYADKLLSRYTAYWGTPTKEEPPMAYKKYTLPGLSNPVFLPDWLQVQITPIPSSVPGWTSGQRWTGQTKITFHDTGNGQSSATGEYNWARGGGRASIGSPGSYNGIVDGVKFIVTQRFDEYVGHAGTDRGNRDGYAIEMAYGAHGYEAALKAACAVHGAIIAAKGWNADTALVPHQYWSGKWCPAQVLNRGQWSRVVKMVSDAAAASRAAAGGQQPSTPTYDKPVVIPELEKFKDKADHEIPYRVNGDGWVALYVGDRVKATKTTPRLRYSSGEGRVGPDLKAGEEFDVDWLLISTDFPDTYYTPWATRIRAADTARVSDVKAS